MRQSVCRPSPGFNGATRSRAWKATVGRLLHHTGNCFNGATRSRAWKGYRVQWLSTSREEASTEPRAHARGKPNRNPNHDLHPNRFNGATRSRAWKDKKTYKTRPSGGEASTEPRAHARGKGEGGADLRTEVLKLQRSHALTRVESAMKWISTQQHRISFNGATRSRAWKERLSPSLS